MQPPFKQHCETIPTNCKAEKKHTRDALYFLQYLFTTVGETSKILVLPLGVIGFILLWGGIIIRCRGL